MDKRTVVKIVGRFRDAIEARGITLFKIILFGSYASDTQHEGSDIDIFVISEDFKGKSYWERGDSFICHFAEHGEVLYAA